MSCVAIWIVFCKSFVGRSIWNCYLKDVLCMLGLAKHCVFRVNGGGRCGEKFTRLRNGFGRWCFAAEPCAIYTRRVDEDSR